ncbi:MAG TPA: hypothetical protein VGX78_00210 [Pirellulales bacterium]|jgi:hypothetical protein|nr:hypothetical protein [Pirellulales bacterium]
MIEPLAMDFMPLWVLFLATLAVVVAAAEGGYRFGRNRWRTSNAAEGTPLGTMVAAILGLLALMLAFTFGLAASRYDDRRKILQEEVNAIGTTYLRAAFLPEPQESEVRTLLREYVDARLEIVQRNTPVADVIRKSEKLHERLWQHAVVAGRESPNSLTVALFVDSLNQMIDVHATVPHTHGHLGCAFLRDHRVDGQHRVPCRWSRRRAIGG